MKFEPSEDQRLLRDSTRDFLTSETRSSLVGGLVEPGHDTGWGPGVTPAGLSPRWPMVA